MTDFIEQDALKSLPDTPPIRDHPHEELKSFIATPRFDPTMLQRVRSLFTSELKPGMHIVHKDGDALRTMFVITSNSYEDREFETITSQALKDYEASCYPGDDLFHCDNPYVLWHDDDIPMGEIIAVNYSEPFLVEIVKELDNPVAKLLWDFAEENGDNAGASHRFGYRSEDRTEDGTYKRIFKQETSYLPDRSLAANIGTYSGVMSDMATKQSDEWFDRVVLERTGGAIKDAAKKMHERTGQLAEELKGLDINHKAFPPKKPADANAAPAPAQDPAQPNEAADQAEDTSEVKTGMTIEEYATIMNQIGGLVMQLVESQGGIMDNQMMLGKSLDAIEGKIEADQTSEKAAKVSLEEKIKALELQVGLLTAQAKLVPRSVTQEKGSTVEAVVEAVKNADKARIEGELIDDPFWGKIKPPMKG